MVITGFGLHHSKALVSQVFIWIQLQKCCKINKHLLGYFMLKIIRKTAWEQFFEFPQPINFIQNCPGHFNYRRFLVQALNMVT